MKGIIKMILGCLFLSLSCSVLGVTTAFAAAEKIDNARITFSYDQAPKAGEAPGTVTAKTTSKQFTVESAEYTNDVDQWRLGDRPEVTVTLSAADGYRFYYTSSSHYKLSGSGVEFRRAKVLDGGSGLTLEVYLKRVEGKPDEVGSLEWDGSYAMWDEIDGVKHYEVRLYRNKGLVTTVTTTKTTYDFRTEITRGGDYTFRVRGIARYDGKAGPWSDYSDESTFSDYEAENYSNGSWIQNQRGWWYRYHNGDYPADCWKNIDGAWYYFNGSGYMLTGWQKISGKWYYLGSNGVMLTGWQNVGGKWYYLDSSGAMLTGWRNLGGAWYYLDPSGAMLTGWQYINNRWYYMETNGVMLTGWRLIGGAWYYLDPSGAMLTGWQQINGRWYYLDSSGAMYTGWHYINGQWYCFDGSGAMYAGQTTPDGHYVDGSGAWRQ